MRPILAASVLLVCLAASFPAVTSTDREPGSPLVSDQLRTYQASPQTRVYLNERNNLFLEVLREAGESLADLAERTMKNPEQWKILLIHNPKAEETPREGYIRIPYSELQDALKYLTIARLFPSDGLQGKYWIHRVGTGKIPLASQSLWHLALWLTGDANHFQEIARLNGIRDLIPAMGQNIRIPRDMLLPVFAHEPPSKEGELSFGRDEQGDYAAYSLKKGEAIYSAVVVRFTGRLDSDEVNDLAEIVVTRSGIRDVRDLPIGFRVKIPLEYVLPEYLPRGNLRRIEHELSRQAVSRFKNKVVSHQLKGVTVILDAGHGGRDRGAANNGVWESDYVYDIVTRIKAKLESETAATVLLTLKDSQYGHRIFDQKKIPNNQSEMVLTTPPFRLSSRSASKVGVNLRWYLANSFLRQQRKKGVPAEKVVFTSVHADSLHPSLRGAMIYVPGEQYRRKKYGFSGPAYRKRKEVREQPYVQFGKKERQRAEGLSREFASHVIRSLKKEEVRIHPYQPIRNRIIRKKRAWVPAVLRCNQASVQILLEACNLNNRHDAQLLAEPRYRQKIADAYVAALLSYYS